MDLATIIGVIAGVSIVFVVMVLDGGSPVELFSHPAAILLIFGGSLAATMITVPLKAMMQMPKFIMKAIFETKYETTEAIEALVSMTDKARREGLLSLEEECKKLKDPFMQKGVMLVVDGVDPAQVKAILETTIEHTRERHHVGIGFFALAGGFAPTFGIIGTVMGLISVLKQLDDPAKLATSIASAFLATLWGLLSANLIYLPLSGKLKAKDQEEAAYNYMIMEGILAIQAGENPRIVKDKLFAYLPPKAASKAAEEPASSGQPATEKAKA